MDIHSTAFGNYLHQIRLDHEYPLCHLAAYLHLSLQEMADIELCHAAAPNIERIAVIMYLFDLSKAESDALVIKAVFSWLISGVDIHEQLEPSTHILTKATGRKRSSEPLLAAVIDNSLRLRVNVCMRDPDNIESIRGIYTDDGDNIPVYVRQVEQAQDRDGVHCICRSNQHRIDLFSDKKGWYIDASALAVS